MSLVITEQSKPKRRFRILYFVEEEKSSSEYFVEEEKSSSEYFAEGEVLYFVDGEAFSIILICEHSIMQIV